MRLLLAFMIVLSAVPAIASTNCHSSERFGGRVVSVGDGERRVFHAAGRPDREASLENRFGAGVGYRVYYYERNKTVRIDIQGGVVTRICVVRD